MLMKQFNLTLLTLLTALLCGTVSARGETVTDYTVDFNTKIDVSNHAFKVAPNWGHIVDSYTDDYSNVYYMQYSWRADYGDSDGALSIPKQEAGDTWDYGTVYDLLVTPVVSGEISFKVKCKGSSYTSYMELYSLNESSTAKETLLKKFTASDMGGSTDWATVNFTVEEAQKIGIRASYLYLDEFKAASAEIVAEPGLTITSAEPSQTTGVIYFDQQPDGKVLVKYTVTVKNTGQTTLTKDDKNYSVSIVKTNGEPIGPATAVPQTLAAGETSEPFDVIAEVEDISSVWSYSGATVKLNLRENITKTTVERAYAGYRAYAPKFIFRESGSTSKNNAEVCDFGFCTEETRKDFEIFNDGNAPLTIKGRTLDNTIGFEVLVVNGNLDNRIIPAGESVTVSLKIVGGTTAAYTGKLTIEYYDKANAVAGEEKTFILPLSGKCTNGKWYTDLNGSNAIEYPAGSVAEDGITNGDQYSSALKKTNYFIKSWTSEDYVNANNKFITPKLHAEAGDKVFYDVARNVNGATSALKVYVSKDRLNWGEPVATHVYADFENDDFQPKSIELPEAGDYYIGFAVFGMKLDNVMGLDKVEVAHDLYITKAEQKEEVQSGAELTATLEFIPLTDAAAADYTIKYVLDGTATDLTSKNLTASAKNKTTFTHDFNPETDVTKTITGHFEIEFTDGTKFTSADMSTVVTCQPDFVFFKKDSYAGSNYKPDSEKNPVAFGKVNAEVMKEFEIYNWGTAPLNVKSVELPEGFTAKDAEGNPVNAVSVPAKARQAVNIVFSATEADYYSGDLKITYVNAAGADEVYTLAVSGTMLDPAKFYCNFGSDSDNATWAPGSVYQKNVGATYTGYSPKDWYLYSTSGTSATDRMFITPKLKAEAGESFMFDSRKDGWNDAEVKLYISDTREGLAADDSRKLLLTLSAQSTEEATLLTDEMKTYSAIIPEAGEYYVGIEIANRARVDEVYGLEVVPVDYDLAVVSSTLPENAMQNVAANGSLFVNNFGLTDVAAEDYELTVFINGEAMAPQTGVALPMEHAANGKGTEIPFEIRSPKAGTFPVYVEIKAGNQTVKSDPVEVTFAEEVLSGEKIVGTPSGVDSGTPLNLNYKNSETIALYTPDMLKLSDGDKISKIVYKGYGSNDWTSTLSVYYKWVDDATIGMPSGTSAYDTADMTQKLNESYVWPKGGSSSDLIDMITLNFDEPLTYQAGKSLMILVRSTSPSFKSGFNFEKSTTSSNCYQHQNDGTEGIFTGSWNSKNLPVLHLGMVVEARTLSGNVTKDGEAVEGAVVTLTSEDNDNVQYEATTDANGAYTVNVIQSGRTYSAHVTADAGEEFADGISVADESGILDFALRPVVVIADDATHSAGATEAVVYLNSIYEPGFNAVALPVALTADEIAAVFGDDAIVYEFKGDDGNTVTPQATFNTVTAMEAGVPYLVYLYRANEPAMFLTKEVSAELRTVQGTSLQFVPTSKVTPLAEGMFAVSDDIFTPSNINALKSVTELPAYRAYLKGNAGVTNVTFATDLVPTEIEDIDADSNNDVRIYDLNGFRVRKADRGIFIINGKKTMVVR